MDASGTFSIRTSPARYMTVPRIDLPRNSGGLSRLPRHDLDGGGASTCADHRAQIRAASVFRSIGLIDAVVDRPIDRFEVLLFWKPQARRSGGKSLSAMQRSGPNSSITVS